MRQRIANGATKSIVFTTVLMVAAMAHRTEAFSLPLQSSSRLPLLSAPQSSSSPMGLHASRSSFDDDDDDDDREREFARVRRRRSRYEDDDDDRYEYESESVMDAADMLEDEGFFDDLDDYDDEDEDYDDDSKEVFSNTVIPNPLLDSIDPDGAAERFPELAADPRFWFDMFLFITFLNFISFIGPRNPFPEMIPQMYTAGLPPPGM